MDSVQHAPDEMMDDLLRDHPPGPGLKHLPCDMVV